MLSAILNNRFKRKNIEEEIYTKVTNDNLENLKPNQSGIVISIGNKGPIKRRLMDMGITPGVKVKVVKVAPFGDPIEINIRGYELSLRKNEATQILIERL